MDDDGESWMTDDDRCYVDFCWIVWQLHEFGSGVDGFGIKQQRPETSHTIWDSKDR